MTSRDVDPSQERPITAEWSGSKITIYDLHGIVHDASANLTSIYDRSDFPYPIERIQITTEVVQQEGEEALALGSIIQLDRTQKWNSKGLNARFRDHLAPQNPQSRDYQSRPPFHIQNAAFSNSFLIVDNDTGSRFILWLQQETDKIIITNNIKLTNGEDKIEINPPAIHSTSPDKQLTSLTRLTALVADFVNAFGENSPFSRQIAGIPLKREYVVGRERRTVTKPSVAKKLGGTGLKHTTSDPDQPSESDNSTWAEDHGIERYNPEEAIKLDDIGGLERAKKILRDVAASFKHPEVMEKWGAERPQGVLLYGEPGTGKTMLAQALANEIDAELWAIQSTDIYERWLGNSEQHIKDIFDRVRKTNKPTILFFDEFESMFGMTGEPLSGADNARNAVAGIFKQEMNTLVTENKNVLVVAATNNLDKIDPSLIRTGRFDYKIYVPMPDQDARQEIAINIISKAILSNEERSFKVFSDDLNVSEIASQTDSFSGADIAEIFRRLSLSRAMEEARSGHEQPPITQAEIEQAILDFRTGG